MNRKSFVWVAVSGLLLLAFASWANSMPTTLQAVAAAPQPKQVGSIVYDQYDNIGFNTTNSQHYEQALRPYDDYCADDFTVGPGQTWTINEVDVAGLVYNGNGPVESFNVSFYTDAAGVPGSEIYTASTLAYTTPGGVEFDIPLTASAVLGPGTYWLMVQANLGQYTGGGNWGWYNRGVQSNAAAAWYNPGDAWGTNCWENWGLRWYCQGDLQHPDQAFRMRGSVVGGPTNTPVLTPTPTFTDTPTGTSVPLTNTPTFTPTATSVPPTNTPTFTPTATPAPPTNTPTGTPTSTPAPASSTVTQTATSTAVAPTNTPTNTATNTVVVPSNTPTLTPTWTAVPSSPTATGTAGACYRCGLRITDVTLSCNVDGSVHWSAIVHNDTACTISTPYLAQLQLRGPDGRFKDRVAQNSHGPVDFAPGATLVQGDLCWHFAPGEKDMRVHVGLLGAATQCHVDGLSSVMQVCSPNPTCGLAP